MLELILDGVVQDRAAYPRGRKLIRSAYDGLRVRSFFTVEEMGPSLTDESQAKGCDLNDIIRRYVAAGVMPEVQQGEFGDVSDVGSYQDLQVRLAEVRRVFMQLAPDMRERFRNDPSVFADFVADPSNVDEGIAIGLYKAREEKPPVEAAAPKATERPPEGGGGSGDGGSATDRKA